MTTEQQRTKEEDYLPTTCEGGFYPAKAADEEPTWKCRLCSAAHPWECQEIPERRSERLHDNARERPREE